MARSGDPAGAVREVGSLKQCLEKVRAAKDDYWAAQVEIQIAEANAWIAKAMGRREGAVALMRSATAQEDALEKRPITPGAIVPAGEQLGELLLELIGKRKRHKIIAFPPDEQGGRLESGYNRGYIQVHNLVCGADKRRNACAQTIKEQDREERWRDAEPGKE